jgi:hypothetical protein
MNGKPEVVQKFISKRIVAAALQRKHIGDEDLKYRSTAHLNRSEVREGGGEGVELVKGYFHVAMVLHRIYPR